MRIVECAQYTAEYWQAHRGLPGASSADKVATPGKGDYPASAQTLIAQLISDRFNPMYGMHEETASKAMQHGLWSEPQARKNLEFELDCTIREVGLCITDDGRFVCSPDGLIGDDGGIEMKVPNTSTHVKYMLDGGLPDCYRPQLHWSLIVTGRPWWIWCSFNHYLPSVIVRVTPDEFTEKLRANMERFHGEYMAALAKVESMIPPPPPPVVLDCGVLGTVEVPAYVSPY